MNKEKGKGLVVSLIKTSTGRNLHETSAVLVFSFFLCVLGLIIICESEFSTNSFSYNKIKSNEN